MISVRFKKLFQRCHCGFNLPIRMIISDTIMTINFLLEALKSCTKLQVDCRNHSVSSYLSLLFPPADYRLTTEFIFQCRGESASGGCCADYPHFPPLSVSLAL